jgi:hypothetical protein
MAMTDWKEVIEDDEATRFDGYAAFLAKNQQSHAGTGGIARALHAKQNLGVEAELVIGGDVPADAKHGMFASRGRYRAVARFSNGAPAKQSDRTPDVRGLAVKVFGVAGTKVIPGLENETTQDFLAIRTSSLPIRNADEFMTLVRAARPKALLPLRLMFALGPRRATQIIRAALGGLKAPQRPLAATSFYSALPIALGPHAVQYAFTARGDAEPVKLGSANTLGDDLAAHLRTQAVTYDLQLRFYTDDKQTPIEDATVEWSSPWVTVGHLTLPVQDPASARGEKVQAFVEQLAFDPWHARADMRPLGNIMRARNVAYRASTQARKAIAEPREAPTFE